ncbi:MAG: iron-sulfur cluster-binding protein [Chloroflexi bacterium]|nr:iron-sulfur cluster-binding protein [Chloroflexota bacterium]
MERSRMARVALIRTNPDTVLGDVGCAMREAHYDATLDRDAQTALKVNVSWHHWYPACSTTPWQLDGVIQTLLADGYQPDGLFAAHNRTVVVDAHIGEQANKHLPVIKKHGIRNIHLYEDEQWTRYEPSGRLRTLHQVYPEGVRIPQRLIGSNIIHLPTMKTHVFTTLTGAMKNAFGGLLFEKRHYCHATIHETLVDLLMIQKEIHPGVFAVVDGTFVGDGPGPRCMQVQERGLLLAGADQVAVDATIARLMGLDPFDIPFLRMAHEDGLGTADSRDIEVCGEDIEQVQWQVEAQRETFASRGQKLIYWGPLKRLEKLLLRTVIAPWSYAASRLYHDVYWYNVIGRGRAKKALTGAWGQLFKKYPG